MRREGLAALDVAYQNKAQSFRTGTPCGALEPALEVSAALGVDWSHPF